MQVLKLYYVDVEVTENIVLHGNQGPTTYIALLDSRQWYNTVQYCFQHSAAQIHLSEAVQTSVIA